LTFAIPDKVDVALIQDNFDYYLNFLDDTDEESYRIFINRELKSTGRDVYTMVPAAVLEKTCRMIEQKQLPFPFASSAHNKTMSALLGHILQMPPQNISKYLKRGVK
jgi:hypothetical protein